MQGQLYLFGRPKLLDREGTQVALPPSLWRVLAIAGADPKSAIGRHVVSEIYWGAQQHGSLRKILWNIRQIEKTCRVDLLEIEDRSIRLSDNVYSDVRELFEENPRHPLSRIYRGPFVDGIDDGASTWMRWIAEQRERFRTVYVARAAASLSNPGLLRSELRREAKRLLEVDSKAEAALRVEVTSDALDGDIPTLRRSYQRLQTHLHDGGRQGSDPARDLYTRLVGSASPQFVEASRGLDPGVPSVCILPPVSGTTASAVRLAHSLVADVTIGLCRNSLFRVLAPHTAGQIDGVDQAEKLGTSYLVTMASMDHVTGGEQVVCTLFAMSDRRVLWSDRIKVAAHYSVEAYNAITEGVLRALMHHIDQATIDAYALQAEPTSYVDFLHGETSLRSLDLRDIRRGRQHLRRAVDRSPAFAPAISALARSFQLEWLLTARGDSDLLNRSHHYACTAVGADPYEARGHRELGFSCLYRKHFDLSIEHYQAAERLNPNYADVLAEYADALVHYGNPTLALEKINKAISLNPLCQDTYFWAKGSALFFLGEYRDAATSLAAMKDRTPAYRLLAAVHALAGETDEASRCRTEAMKLHPEMNLERWIDIVPFRDPRQVQHYYEGLKLAGFN